MEECQQGITELSISNGCQSRRASTEGVLAVNDKPEVVDVLTEYFRPLHKEYLEQKGQTQLYDPKLFKLDRNLMRSVFEFTWGPDVFKAPRPMLKRLHKELSQKFQAGPSDSDHLIQYFHVDAISTRLNLLVLSIALADINLVTQEISLLNMFIDDDRICRYSVATDACRFLLNALESLYDSLSTIHDDVWSKKILFTDYNTLPMLTQNFVKGLSVLFIKMFRVKNQERCDLMRMVQQNDKGSLEWTIYLSEMLRLKRRDVKPGRSKFPTKEEMDLVAQSLKMESTNPFVRLNLIDSVVDAMRESNGRFMCGELSDTHLQLRDSEHAIQWLRNECEKLTADFRYSVHINCIISDIFLRFVPARYFDPPFSKELLQTAYNLNPKNSRTCHRFGIFYRMTEKNIDMSLEFLEKSLCLDLGFYSANMDYFKTLLGKPDKYREVACRMKRRLASEEALGWRTVEISEFRFVLGIAYFAAGNKEETLRQWQEVMKLTEMPFSLSDLDQDCEFYHWDANVIGAEKLRGWMQNEFSTMESLEEHGDPAFDPEKKKVVGRLFHLMLGVQPMRPFPTPSPYTADFEHRMNQRILNEIMMGI
ncbi:unnamed protein product [Orchesella dallaii]|uniref:Uncharacterized protein n=1 Tax=Orchesella dallaii TaxID=48710 RepID=A0ABP1QH81_9HEXA